MNNIKEYVRAANGRFASYNWKRLEQRVIIGIMVVSGIVLGGGLLTNNYEFLNTWFTKENVLTYVAPEMVFAAEEKVEGLTAEQLEAKLDAIVWGGESNHYVMKDGETYPTFDPPKRLMAKCSTRGGKIHGECLSYGPRQTKIPTIQGDWPTLRDGAKLTEKAARDCAEDNECSRRYFLDSSIYIKGGVGKWCAAHVNNDCDMPIRTDVQMYVDLIREAKGIKID